MPVDVVAVDVASVPVVVPVVVVELTPVVEEAGVPKSVSPVVPEGAVVVSVELGVSAPPPNPAPAPVTSISSLSSSVLSVGSVNSSTISPVLLFLHFPPCPSSKVVPVRI